MLLDPLDSWSRKMSRLVITPVSSLFDALRLLDVARLQQKSDIGALLMRNGLKWLHGYDPSKVYIKASYGSALC